MTSFYDNLKALNAALVRAEANDVTVRVMGSRALPGYYIGTKEDLTVAYSVDNLIDRINKMVDKII